MQGFDHGIAERGKPPFRPVQRIPPGYLPLEDYGLIGDGSTAALVGRDGSIDWLCVPDFDSPPLFCRLLDEARGGAMRFQIEDGFGIPLPVHGRQFYIPDTAVLVTELRTETARLRITDSMTVQPGADLVANVVAARRELLRCIEVLEGKATVLLIVEPRGGGSVTRADGGFRLWPNRHVGMSLRLHATHPVSGWPPRWELTSADRLDVALRWNEEEPIEPPPDPRESLEATLSAWRAWAGRLAYEGPRAALVRRSALTLKLLDHMENGAIVASPTSSLPERIGGERNWDYRYSWIRDAAFSVYALRRVGLGREADGFLHWVMQAIEKDGRPRVLYTIHGTTPPEEREDAELTGYLGSSPVRWGNAAMHQRQHDVYGEILDCAYQMVAHGGAIDDALWRQLVRLIDSAGREWTEPDHGIWEVRCAGRPFTYSAALCHVALDRGARLARQLGFEGDVAGWERSASRIRQAILERAWDPQRRSLTEALGGGGLDASVLSLPMRRVLRADHPRMKATTERIAKELGAGHGLLYRYHPDESPDGLPGNEGAFLLCSFWLVENLAYQKRLDEAHQLYDSLCDRAGCLGLLPEQIDPVGGGFLGNYPQAFSHIGVISAGLRLARMERNVVDGGGESS